MAGCALKMESILERKQTMIGFLFVAGITGLPLSAPVIQECVEIVVAPNAVQLFRMELVIEHDLRPLECSVLGTIKQDGIFLGMSRRAESGKNQDNRQKFYVCHRNSLHSYSLSKTLSRRVNPGLPHRRRQKV
jgi:hypothetical protein